MLTNPNPGVPIETKEDYIHRGGSEKSNAVRHEKAVANRFSALSGGKGFERVR